MKTTAARLLLILAGGIGTAATAQAARTRPDGRRRRRGRAVPFHRNG